MHSELISETERFLKNTFDSSIYLQNNPAERSYRLEHSYRVANIARSIAQAEGLNVTEAVIAALLHDIAYCEEMPTKEDRMNHGRRSAAIARPFLLQLGLSDVSVNDICYSIAIHVDDQADFPWERTAFSETVGDADNIDRFDAYRIYETLQFIHFSEMSLSDKHSHVSSMIEKLTRYKDLKFGTTTTKELWIQQLDFQLSFYEKLRSQLDSSGSILDK